MAVQLGSGEYTFEVNENWAKVPEEILRLFDASRLPKNALKAAAL